MTNLGWAAFGAEGAFREGTLVASTPWSVAMCVLGLAAAIVGGCASRLVAKEKGREATLALAVLVLLLGHAMAFGQAGSEPAPLPEGKSVADLTFFEAGGLARPPAWYSFLIPWIGAAGVMLGASFRRFMG